MQPGRALRLNGFEARREAGRTSTYLTPPVERSYVPANPPLDQMLNDWKQAEERARNAEVLLYRAYADFLSGRGPAPAEEQKEEAARFREEARRAYQAAMAAVSRVLDEADKRSRGW